MQQTTPKLQEFTSPSIRLSQTLGDVEKVRRARGGWHLGTEASASSPPLHPNGMDYCSYPQEKKGKFYLYSPTDHHVTDTCYSENIPPIGKIAMCFK